MPAQQRNDGAPPDDEPPYKRNGFSTPHHPLQIASWVVFPVFVAGFYALALPPIPSEAARWTLGIVHGLLAVVVGRLAHHVTGVDPVDANVCPAQRAKDAAARTDPRDGIDWRDERYVYCYRCEHRVFADSKHCRICNKCVDVFDHHCKWLNNCIGGQNYSQFVALIASVFAMTFGQVRHKNRKRMPPLLFTKLFQRLFVMCSRPGLSFR